MKLYFLTRPRLAKPSSSIREAKEEEDREAEAEQQNLEIAFRRETNKFLRIFSRILGVARSAYYMSRFEFLRFFRIFTIVYL